jgi:hypothetical protein
MGIAATGFCHPGGILQFFHLEDQQILWLPLAAVKSLQQNSSPTSTIIYIVKIFTASSSRINLWSALSRQQPASFCNQICIRAGWNSKKQCRLVYSKDKSKQSNNGTSRNIGKKSTSSQDHSLKSRSRRQPVGKKEKICYRIKPQKRHHESINRGWQDQNQQDSISKTDQRSPYSTRKATSRKHPS